MLRRWKVLIQKCEKVLHSLKFPNPVSTSLILDPTHRRSEALHTAGEFPAQIDSDYIVIDTVCKKDWGLQRILDVGGFIRAIVKYRMRKLMQFGVIKSGELLKYGPSQTPLSSFDARPNRQIAFETVTIQRSQQRLRGIQPRSAMHGWPRHTLG